MGLKTHLITCEKNIFSVVLSWQVLKIIKFITNLYFYFRGIQQF